MRNAILSSLTFCGLVIVLTANLPTVRASEPIQTQKTSTPLNIVVNAREASTVTTSTTVTLQQALAQAAIDPRNNMIRFDPTIFETEPTLLLSKTIALNMFNVGHDHLDGAVGHKTITLNFTNETEAGIHIKGTGRITLSNLNIRGKTQRGILIQTAARLTAHNTTVTGSEGPGIAIFNQAAAELHNCRIQNNNTHGIELHNHSSIDLQNTQLSNNGQSALATFDRARCVAGHCLMHDNGPWNLLLTNQSRIKLTNTAISAGRFANADASETATLELDNCTLEKGKRFGLFATGQTNITLVNTHLTDHAGRGIELQDQARLKISQCSITSNGEYGLLLFAQASVQASDTRFDNNGAHGTSLQDAASGRFERCQFTNNRFSGVGCPDAADGGTVEITQCLFKNNGLRPVYRGPIHIDPLVPTPLYIDDKQVHCLAAPNAKIELYLDRAGEASHYLKTLQGDANGYFTIDRNDITEGYVITATATIDRQTSEFNVIAAPQSGPILHALLAQTGPLADNPEPSRLDAHLRRWPNKTHLVFHLHNPPGDGIERYARFMTTLIGTWTRGKITAETRVGRNADIPSGAVVIPIRYVPANTPCLQGRGGLTFLKWNWDGSFASPMEIVVATADPPTDSCPRVLAHEIGHTLGLNHVRVGLLSRMQGSIPPQKTNRINDFSPMLTFYDVQALQLLYGRNTFPGVTLANLIKRGLIPPASATALAKAEHRPPNATFSPAAAHAPGAPPQKPTHP